MEIFIGLAIGFALGCLLVFSDRKKRAEKTDDKALDSRFQMAVERQRLFDGPGPHRGDIVTLEPSRGDSNTALAKRVYSLEQVLDLTLKAAGLVAIQNENGDRRVIKQAEFKRYQKVKAKAEAEMKRIVTGEERDFHRADTRAYHLGGCGRENKKSE